MKKMPLPDSSDAPKYWRYETGVLPATMDRFLKGEPLSLHDLAILNLYLRQWIDSPAWDLNPHLTDGGRYDLRELRRQTREARTEPAIRRAVMRMTELGMDPL